MTFDKENVLKIFKYKKLIKFFYYIIILYGLILITNSTAGIFRHFIYTYVSNESSLSETVIYIAQLRIPSLLCGFLYLYAAKAIRYIFEVIEDMEKTV